MANNTVEIKFKGDSGNLTKAIKQLDNATKNLLKTQAKIEDFNNRYISTNNDSYQLRTRAPQETKPIGITKKFSFKPGAYATIKAIINAAQCFNMRAQSLTKVIERARNEGSWRLRNINTEINNIEIILITLRRNGIVMQDNSDDAIEAYQLLKNHLIEQYQNNNGSFNIRIEDIKNDNDE